MAEDARKTPLELWAHEPHQDILELRYRVRRTLFSGRSEFQQVDIVETAGFGRMLFNDGLAMISERDEWVYHDMISHVPLFVHPAPRRVLVIGGGDGGTVREVLRHQQVESCRLVEIDPLVVDGCREHIPRTAAALDDPRAEVTIGDGVRFVADWAERAERAEAAERERFDVVIVDSTDPIGPATPLFGAEFYGNVQRVLADDGIVVSQAESPFYELERQQSMLRILSGLFPRVHLYNYTNMIYPGGLWSFTFATKGPRCPVADLDEARIVGSGLTFEYYSADVHRAAFALPAFQRRALDEWLTPFGRR